MGITLDESHEIAYRYLPIYYFYCLGKGRNIEFSRDNLYQMIEPKVLESRRSKVKSDVLLGHRIRPHLEAALSCVMTGELFRVLLSNFWMRKIGMFYVLPSPVRIIGSTYMGSPCEVIDLENCIADMAKLWRRRRRLSLKFHEIGIIYEFIVCSNTFIVCHAFSTLNDNMWFN